MMLYLTIGAVVFVCFTIFLFTVYYKNLPINEDGQRCRKLKSREKEYLWELMDNVFYNLYHDNSPYTRQVNYNLYVWMREVMEVGVPIFCGGISYLKKAPTRFSNEYIVKKQAPKKKEVKHAKATYGAFQNGKVYKRYKNANGYYEKVEVSEDEFLDNANQEEIDKYYGIKESLERERLARERKYA